MRNLYLLLPVFVALLTAGCRPQNPVGELLRQAEEQMESQPDSVLRLLERIDPQTLNTRRLRARHALLHSQALDKNYIDLTSDSIIAPAVHYFARRGSSRDKAFTTYYLGRIRNNAGESSEAARLMLDASRHAERAGETYLLGMIYSCRGNLYYS